ncbi:MAG TPA: UvrD-helicase domain-containing protein [Pseudonocardiaceae bacterium]|nr:UvrD-helicase domain-containing protein [Pseudonocardiaceae bacterium]
MRHYVDLHIHSKYSRACSRDCDLEHLSWWARRKGITVIGTGDLTHPAWAEEIRTKLVPAEDGLFKLREDLDREVLRTLPSRCHTPVRFLLEVEISTIYKRDDKTRKVHHLCYLPDIAAGEEFTRRLGKIGNLGSDGRPILGLDSRDLLEITLESGEGGYLIPAHAWTPWFAVLGSKSGFDAVEDCYLDLADTIFAVETGLSSDPSMNWRVSKLDRFHLVANSDAHSPPMLGRNATVLDTELGYGNLRRALETGEGYVGTLDMFPEEGKYHHDGHRKCGVHLEPGDTKALGGKCPECGKPLTLGVLYRVDELADRPEGRKPATAGEFQHVLALPEIMGEILGVGPKSKKVTQAVDQLVNTLGPELGILLELPIDEIRTARNPLLTEAIERLRAGRVHREAGYDGEYGTISIFEPGELSAGDMAAPGLFGLDLPKARKAAKPKKVVASVEEPASAPAEPKPAGGLLDGLDPDQRAAAEVVEGPLLIVAGPGTGKTRTLTHRIAHLITAHDVAPQHCLAITFTRRACEEMRERLETLVPEQARRTTVATFHRLGLDLLREQHALAGLPEDFGIADEGSQLAVIRELLGTGTLRDARKALEEVSAHRRAGTTSELAERYEKTLHGNGFVDFDDLIALPVALLTDHPELAEQYRDRFRYICVDEYQDVDELQYRLLRLLAPADGNLCAIGDPDQAIYAFRGADVGFFLRFAQDFPTAKSVALTRNYRSSAVIVASAVAAITPTTLVPDRGLHAMRDAPAAERIAIHAAADEEAEAAFTVRAIEELLGGSSFHSRDSGLVDSHGFAGGLSFDDIAVLYRTDAQARPIMSALAHKGLPFQKRSHNRLAKHVGVRAIVAELPESADGIALPVLLRRAAQLVTPTDELDPATVAEALELLLPLAGTQGMDLAGFRAELSLGAEVDTWDPRANRISLLTLHAAKGLEFPVVFIVGCAEGLLPFRWPGDDDADAEAEERRLFFVGVSRAQSHLYLSHSRKRTRNGTSTDSRPSPFLSVFTDELANRTEDVGQARVARSQQLRLL